MERWGGVHAASASLGLSFPAWLGDRYTSTVYNVKGEIGRRLFGNLQHPRHRIVLCVNLPSSHPPLRLGAPGSTASAYACATSAPASASRDSVTRKPAGVKPAVGIATPSAPRAGCGEGRPPARQPRSSCAALSGGRVLRRPRRDSQGLEPAGPRARALCLARSRNPFGPVTRLG